MIPTLPLEAVSERDIDLLLCEEWSVNADFRNRFLVRVSGELEDLEFVRLAHSVADPVHGESDVVMLLKHGDHRHALLIENKIAAIAQPEQATRYAKRAAEGQASGHWGSFHSCIIAPALYLERTDDAHRYQARISYEDIAHDLLASTGIDDARRAWRHACILQAIEQNRRGYSPKPNREVTDFWFEYWKECQRTFPQLGMSQPSSKPGKSSWIRFAPGTVEGRISLQHKTERGAVDLKLAYKSDQLAECRAILAPILEPDMSVVATGGICSLRIRVPTLDIRLPFADQAEQARHGMQAACRIATICPLIREHIRL